MPRHDTCQFGDPPENVPSRIRSLLAVRLLTVRLANLRCATARTREISVLSENSIFGVKRVCRCQIMAHSKRATMIGGTFRAVGASLHFRIDNAGRNVIIAALTLALFGCTLFYRPQPAANLNSLEQVRTQTDGKVRISAAVLSAEESRRVFGVALYDSGVQPVWVS